MVIWLGEKIGQILEFDIDNFVNIEFHNNIFLDVIYGLNTRLFMWMDVNFHINVSSTNCVLKIWDNLHNVKKKIKRRKIIK